MSKASVAGSRFELRQVVHPDFPAQEVSSPRLVGSFSSREEAEAERQRRESEVRRQVNPFALRLGRLASLTSLDPPIFRDWLLDQGVQPPSDRDWSAWWSHEAKHWPKALLESVWDRLDRVRFFEIVEAAMPSEVYAVVQIGWHWCDEPPYYTSPETRQALEVFTTREKAEARRAELQMQLETDWHDHELFAAPEEGAQPGTEVRHFEVIAIPWENQG